MARKGSQVGPHILSLIEDARIDLARAAYPVWKSENLVSNCPKGHRSFKFRI